MVRNGDALSGQQLAHPALISGGGDGCDRIVDQSHRFGHGGGGDGGDIVHADHRIDRAMSGEFDGGLRGRPRISNIEPQDIARRVRQLSVPRSIPRVTRFYMACCLDEGICSVGTGRQQEQQSRHNCLMQWTVGYYPGCSKRLSSNAAAGEGPRRTLGVR